MLHDVMEIGTETLKATGCAFAIAGETAAADAAVKEKRMARVDMVLLSGASDLFARVRLGCVDPKAGLSARLLSSKNRLRLSDRTDIVKQSRACSIYVEAAVAVRAYVS